MAEISFGTEEVAAIFRAYTPKVRAELMVLRKLIFDVAKSTPGVGVLEETLRWKQPSYLTSTTGSGSTIRIDAHQNSASGYAIYFHCQSGLVDQFKVLYGNTFAFEGNRAIIFEIGKNPPLNELRHCISLALTHHLRKKT